MSIAKVLRSCPRLVPDGMGRTWLALLPLALVTVALEAAGALAVYALVRVLADPSTALAIPLVGTLAGVLGVHDQRALVLTMASATALLYVLKNGIAVLSVTVRSWCVEHATAATATALLRRYLGVPWSVAMQRSSAELIYNVDQAVPRVYATVLAAALGVATEALVTAAIALLLLAAAPGTTLAAGAILAAVAWAFITRTRRRAGALGRRLDSGRERALRSLQHALGASKELAVLGRSSFLVDAFAADQAELARVRTRHDVLAELPRLVIETTFVGAALLMVVLATYAAGGGAQSLPLLSLFAYAGLRVIPSVNRMVWQLGEIRFGLPALERVERDLALPCRDTDEVQAPRIFDRIALDGVSFTYPGATRPALRDVHLVVRRGESLGVVGATGAGKSTLVDVVAGLLDPATGRVLVDGVDLRQCRSAWQAGLAYVPQEVFLLDDTLRANVALGVPPDEVNEQRLATAITHAQLEAFVASQPFGLDTVVGERGARLSGGERQRVGIARALYREPQLLLLDEATASLDTRTEADLARALEALRHTTTLIVVAHRLGTVRGCDRLLLLADGQVADVGTWDELVARSERFRALAAAGGAAS